MKYSTIAPTQAGWYWLRFPGEATGDVVSVLLSDKGYEAKGNLGWSLVSGEYLKGVEWAGPINEPKE